MADPYDVKKNGTLVEEAHAISGNISSVEKNAVPGKSDFFHLKMGIDPFDSDDTIYVEACLPHNNVYNEIWKNCHHADTVEINITPRAFSLESFSR